VTETLKLSDVCAHVQAPVILSQGNLQEKVVEVLAAVQADQATSGGTADLPKVVLVTFFRGCPLRLCVC